MLNFYPFKNDKIESMSNNVISNIRNDLGNKIDHFNSNNNDFITVFSNISKITDNIYLSGIYGADNIDKLNEYNIKCILNCTKNEPNVFENNSDMTYMRIPVNDMGGQHIEQYFDSTYNFIEKCTSMNKNVLVHCHAGVSRSATILIAYFMRKNKISYQEAFDFVKSKRSIIGPNFDFRDALRNYKYP